MKSVVPIVLGILIVLLVSGCIANEGNNITGKLISIHVLKKEINEHGPPA